MVIELKCPIREKCRKVKIRKSGNSLVVTIPPEIAKYADMKKETLVSLISTGKGKIEIEIAG